MKKILIISPHFPPSNLVGVHRARLLSIHLPEYGWEPIVLTVHEKYYEQSLDANLEKLLPKNLRIEKVDALRITRPRTVGDIGIRAFRSLYKRAKQIIRDEQIDFVFITIPSFYTALLGRWLHQTTKVPYGIDYQDPWVHNFPGSEKLFSRHWFATKLSRILEPIAVKKASLITGVAEGYYSDVVKRNPHLRESSLFANLPIGIEPSDYDAIKHIPIRPYLFKKETGKIKLIYAGAMLPKSYRPLELICKAISEHPEKYADIEIHFIGTGKNPVDPEGYSIKPIVEKFGLWEKPFFEHPARIPYLDVLAHLKEADGIFILGSTEIHYSPSKVYQGIASEKPVFAILHEKSSAVGVINQTNAGIVLTFSGEKGVSEIYYSFDTSFGELRKFISRYKPEIIKEGEFQNYFASSLTNTLVSFLNQIVPDAESGRKILIISPHFPPSNLTAVHRARLFSQHLPGFNWTPVVLTVDELYYEEEPDYNLLKLVPSSVRIEKVKASKVHKPRVIGDIGLRSFYSLYKRAKEIITNEKIDFLYVIIPSFYGALWGRWLNSTTGIKYGIDYVDPWVHLFPGGDKLFSRAWFATYLSRFLEPIAVKKASLITGVAESYYKDVFIRNKNLSKSCASLTLPPAGEQQDFERIRELNLVPTIFKSDDSKMQLVYAGAMLPKAYSILKNIFEAIQKNIKTFECLELYFIGTGKSTNDPNGFNIKPLAEKYGLWQKQVFEYPARIPYLDVLVHLNAADGAFILGSTEPHYTPSKVYQAVLSKKPILAVLHRESTGVKVIRDSQAGVVIDFDGEGDLERVRNIFVERFAEFKVFSDRYNYDLIDHAIFEKYSAEKITEKLVNGINEIISR